MYKNKEVILKFSKLIIKRLFLFAILIATTPVAIADIIDFQFTGKFTLVSADNRVALQVPIESTLTYNSNRDIGSAGLIVSPFFVFFSDLTLYDITLRRIDNTNLILGNMLGDFSRTTGIPISMIWDASGLFNAIEYGLQEGDVLSGTNLIRNGSVVYDINSAIPATDGYLDEGSRDAGILNQGPAPLAMTTFNTFPLCVRESDETGCLGVAVSGGANYTDDGIPGSPIIAGYETLNVNLDIGSGNSLTVLRVSSVPLPSAVWLFFSGLFGIVMLARKKHFSGN